MLVLFPIMCVKIYLVNTEKRFRMTVFFIVMIVIMDLLYLWIRPSYTYEEAKIIVTEEYNVVVGESHFKTIQEFETKKDNYKMIVWKDSIKKELSFNPYTGKVIWLNYKKP